MRSTRIYIHRGNLINNFRIIEKLCGTAKICAAVKADGYGHGAVETAEILEGIGCSSFGVATVKEAEELIDNGIKKPIILFSLTTPEEAPEIVRLGIEPVVTDLDYIKSLERESVSLNRIVKVHLKVDTGMGRIGCSPDQALVIASYIEESPNLILKGLCTHFSTSEDENREITLNQLALFKNVIRILKESSIEPELIHAANSGAIINHPDSIFNMVRPGIALYGYPPLINFPDYGMFKPVLELKTKIVALKDVPKGTAISYGRSFITEKKTKIATLPIGYGDGYFRALSNRASVFINGRLYPVVGNICMDQMMIEVDSRVSLYDDVILIGTEKNQPDARTLAAEIGTISYEILTSLQRVERFLL